MSREPLTAGEITDLIDRQIRQLDLPAEPAGLYDPIRYILGLGGKRLRPLLALMSYNLFADDVGPMVLPALSIEVFHNFTLVHDDIMDKAPIRRGKATVHKKWHDNIALLSGDAMLVKAYALLAQTTAGKLPQLLTAFNKTALQVCEGQQLDMDFEKRGFAHNPVTEAEYLQMIRLKTAVLFGFSLQFGSLASGRDTQVSALLYDAGVHLGLAFQLQDDLLDVFGGEKFGKQTGGDILNAKKTYLLVKVLELAGGDDRQGIIAAITHNKMADSAKVATIKDYYTRYAVEEVAQSEIDSHLNNFFAALDTLGSNRTGRIKALVQSLATRAV